MEKTVSIKLRHPVQLADRLMDKVVMRRPTVGDIIDHPIRDGSDLAGESALYAHLCGLNHEDFRALDAEDYQEIQRNYLLFRGHAV